MAEVLASVLGRAPNESDLASGVLYRSPRTLVYRATSPHGGRVVCKRPLGPDAVARARHETRILDRLAGIPGTAQRVVADGFPGAVVMAELPGEPLSRTLEAGPLGIPEAATLALTLARIVAAVHGRGVLHKDVNPQNVLYGRREAHVALVDFDLATTYAQERPVFTHHRRVAGTLAYLAPEQTGRTGRPVDQRSDLYALGATLYELLTGFPPFVQEDPLALIHDHLVRVPRPPAEVAPAVPRAFSAIVMRLLEKEPDRRYQSAEGLAADLARLPSAPDGFVLGEHDFPAILLAPSRLIGRDAERAALRAAFERSLTTQERAVFVTGAPGVGKSALVDELRTVATEHGGWFVKGKFDRLAGGGTGLRDALRALGRLLLAEPDAALAAHRARIEAAVGSAAGRIGRLVPEFASILGTTAECGENAVEAELQLRDATLRLFGALASPARPLVLFLDDLQWAADHVLGVVDAIVRDESLRGLAFVGAYRNGEVDRTHPLAAALERWDRFGERVMKVELCDLRPVDVSTLLAEMLRLPPGEAERLADTVAAKTKGNPFDTVELVNALRRDGALVLAGDGWTWDDARIRRYVGGGSVIDLLAVRIDRLPQDARAALRVVACLGAEVELTVLDAALEPSRLAAASRLEPAFEDGLLVSERDGTIRFSHDRVQQAAYESVAPADRPALHLAIARRLLSADHEFAQHAAAQYALALPAVEDPQEASLAAELLDGAAAGARVASSYVHVERFLAAAVALLVDVAGGSDVRSIRRLQIERHAALYHLGRYEEGDALYRRLESDGCDVVQLAAAACVQVRSLSNRVRHREAVGLGLALLPRLGMPGLPADVRGEVERGYETLQDWIAEVMPALAAPTETERDARVLVAAQLATRLIPSAFFEDPVVAYWLSLERYRLWLERGRPVEITHGVIDAAFGLIALKGHYAAAYAFARFLVAQLVRVPGIPFARERHVFELVAVHWVEPLDRIVKDALQTREALIRTGDLQFACFTYYDSLAAHLECAPSLDEVRAEAEGAVAFAQRTANEHTRAAYVSYVACVAALQGETAGWDPAGTAPRELRSDGLIDNPMAAAIAHVNLALAAAVLGEDEALFSQSAQAMPLLAFVAGFYVVAQAYLLRALALAARIRGRSDAERGADERHELDACVDWLARRAVDAPHNFSHLAHFVRAERAWAFGDRAEAAAAFDLALRESGERARPWHRALIAERAGLLMCEYGLDRLAGCGLLREARDAYRAWGAAAKVERLERAHPFLQTLESAPLERAARTITASSEDIDLLAILRVSQALSAETVLDELRARIAESLAAMTGATMVHVASFDDDRRRWFVTVGGAALPLEEAAERAAFPRTAFSYAERTREPLLVDDATKDDRFASDPFVARLELCSLLAVPILAAGALRAVIVLVNDRSSGAFTTDRLEAVRLLAGQLAVSLENASLYASLERKVAERTEALELANRRLETLSITDSLTGLANRRRFVEFLEAEWKRGLRAKTSLGLAIVDVDHFKRYNDRYGHPAGDACLERIANVMSAQVREGIDLVARYGGEEFAIVLSGATPAGAMRVVERVRHAIAALALPHASSEYGIVTVSIGAVARVPDESVETRDFVAAADAALYTAKMGGRNRVAQGPP